MAASQLWQVLAPTGTDTGVFRASKALYTAIGADVGVTAVAAAAGKSTPTYSIGELLKVGWLVAVSVYLQQSTKKTSIVTVYCSSTKVEEFIAKCRTDPSSGLVVNAKPVVSATRPRRQSFS
jgi:hypothetical protein